MYLRGHGTATAQVLVLELAAAYSALVCSAPQNSVNGVLLHPNTTAHAAYSEMCGVVIVDVWFCQWHESLL